jgi:hypothetical protein
MPEPLSNNTVSELEGIARRLTVDALTALAKSVAGPPPEGIGWNPRDRYWFAGTAGLKFTSDEKRVLRKLWTRIQAGLMYTHAHEDVDVAVRRPGLMAALDRFVQPNVDYQIEGRAATFLERALGREVWSSVIGIWNASCAALLSDRLPAPLRADLEWSWRTALGATPSELLSQGSTGPDLIRPLADQAPKAR